ncbi:retron system putative HNH endonuclease [Falsiruegeria litorea]|uniref:retron system putative HNH endonuclease n=1 Tax=Falsiruegeria litorea TaxID=1280831 RepID=UPI001BFDCBBC|nr:retron system putative HNH endonuclease [Falsiruegeria litorea]MBT8169862.1 TIGR02646 family protein [Falsiruegeria litorea]
MIKIIKTDEPDLVKSWKSLACSEWQPTWENLQNPEKNALLQQLIIDQKGVCCYCECAINPDNSHIEHIIPRSLDASKKLSYDNLLASCLRETEKGVPLTCGKARGNWHDSTSYLNPCDTESEDQIIYLMDGRVTSTSSLHHQFLLNLNLNSALKVSARKAAAAIFSEDDSVTDVKKILNAALNGDELPEYVSFLFATATAYFGIDGLAVM